jgi:hypothetical protein
MAYGVETWKFTARLINKFKVAQRAMKRAILEVSLRDRIQNEMTWQRTKVTDIAHRISTLMEQWTGHIINHRTDNRWDKQVLERKPHLGIRSVGQV